MTKMTKEEALEWVAVQDEEGEIDDEDLDAACRALDINPDDWRGSEEEGDEIDRRWDMVCIEAEKEVWGQKE